MSAGATHARIVAIGMVLFGLMIQVVGCGTTRGQKGDDALDTEGYRNAIRYYEQELERRPGDAHLERDLGFAYLKSGNYPKAERALRQARMFDWEDGATVLYLAMGSEAMGRLGDAIDQYRAYTSLQTFTGYHGDAERRLRVLIHERDAQWAAMRIAEEDSLGPPPPHSNPIAVFRFGVSDPRGRVDGLADALAEQLVADLARVRRLRLLDVARLDALLQALPLAGTVDSTTAPRLGRLAGARYCVTGKAVVQPNDLLRIEATILETETGVSMPVQGEASLDDFFRLEKTMVSRMLDAMSIVPTDRERAAISPSPTHSLPAYLSYGQGVASERGTDYAAALRHYREAIRLDSGFAAPAVASAGLSGAGQEIPTIVAFIQAVEPPMDFVGPNPSVMEDIVPDRQRDTENEATDDIEDRPDDFRVPPQAPIQIPDPPMPPGG